MGEAPRIGGPVLGLILYGNRARYHSIIDYEDSETCFHSGEILPEFPVLGEADWSPGIIFHF